MTDVGILRLFKRSNGCVVLFLKLVLIQHLSSFIAYMPAGGWLLVLSDYQSSFLTSVIQHRAGKCKRGKLICTRCKNFELLQ